MATVTVYDAARTQEIENSAVIGGHVDGDNLILERFDGGEIDAGNVRGPVGTPGVSEATFNETMSDSMPVGMVVDYMGTTSPSPNWLKMEGQTVANAQTLYPAWWAILAATMKSGSSAIMPDTRGRVAVGYNAGDADFSVIGKLGGSKTHTLSQAEIPSHLHSIQHNHPAKTSSIANIGHQHDLAHTHNSTYTGTSGSAHQHEAGTLYTGPEDAYHYHTMDPAAGGSQYFVHANSVASIGGYFEPGLVIPTGVGVWGNTANQSGFHGHDVTGATAEDGLHQHNFNTPPVPPGEQYSGVSGDNHTHVVDLDDFIGNSGNTGGGSAHNNVQPYITFMKIVKVL